MASSKKSTHPPSVPLIDILVNIAAVVHPLTALPQLMTIYSSHVVTGISLWTWVGFLLIGLVFLAYGIVHRIKPIIVTQVLWFIVDLLVIVGIILYQ
jgi:uncharacterized protein with PQ loop repeat